MEKKRYLIFYLATFILLSTSMLSCESFTHTEPSIITTPTPTPFPWARHTGLWYSIDSDINLTLQLNKSGSKIVHVKVPGRSMECNDYNVSFSGFDSTGIWSVKSTGEFQVTTDSLVVYGTFQKDGKSARGTWSIPPCQGSWTAKELLTMH